MPTREAFVAVLAFFVIAILGALLLVRSRRRRDPSKAAAVGYSSATAVRSDNKLACLEERPTVRPDHVGPTEILCARRFGDALQPAHASRSAGLDARRGCPRTVSIAATASNH